MLHESYIDSAPTGPFDGAACLLTLHFLPPDERLQTLKRILLRLKPGGAPGRRASQLSQRGFGRG
jgi:tRNA (cmo5U34)-methyltransferase